MKRGEPEAGRLWLQIDLALAGTELRALARGCHGEEPAAHLLGPQSSLDALLEFAEWVREAAARGVPLNPPAQAQQIYQALFREGLQEVLFQLRGAARGEPLMLRLNPGEQSLHSVPWEALCRPGTTLDFLGTSPELCIARGASSTKSFAPYQVEGAVRLLIISPSDVEAPERLRAALHPSIEAGGLEWLTPLTGAHASMAHVLQRLRQPPVPHIVHFIGHGGLDEGGNPTLRLGDKEGQESWLKVELLAKELEALFRNELRLVLLEACEGARPGTLPSAAALLAQAGAGAVVAHLWPVRADVARRCSMSFYRSLSGTAAHRGDVGRSLHDARRTLLAEFEESAEAFSPVLYLRGHDTTLFDFQGRELGTPSSVSMATQGGSVQPVAHAPGVATANEIIDFELERGRHGTLLGREDVLAELDALLLDGSSRGWVLVKGSPGLGKSALLAEWLKRCEAAGRRIPHHFLRRGVEDWDRPEVVKRNLAAQVEALYPEMVDLEARPESRLSKLLQRVSNQVLAPSQEQLVLLVDGLDEVEEAADGSNPLPSFLPHVLPPGVKVLCASRPTYPHLSWLEARDRVRTIDLDEEQWAGSNRQVVREYWKRASPRFKPPLTRAFVEEIVQRAEGNVLYAVKLAEWLESQPVEKRRAELLPRGLEALLDESWEPLQRLSADLREVAEEGLGVVAVAREALPRSTLSAVAGWKELVDPDRFLRVARPFLLEETGPGSGEKAWRPFHESFRSFILAKLGPERERVLHLRLAEQICRWPVGTAAGSFRRSYVLRHGVTHWLKAEQWEQARGLYTDLGYLEKKCQEAGVLSVEEALKGVVLEAPEKDWNTARALQRAIQAGSHVLKREAKALPLYVYNWLRCGGWEQERIEKELRFLGRLPELRLRHPVRAGGHGRTLEGHGFFVNGCAVTPDGRHVVSASEDKTLKVWELETGREVATLEGHESPVAGCAVTPDGRYVVSASSAKELKVWELETGREVATLEGHGDKVAGCAVTPDGRHVVSASEDKTLKVWELETGRQVATLKGHEGSVAGCAVTPDGRHVVSASGDKTLKVWELETRREVATLKGHRHTVTGCAVTPDGRHVVSASFDGTLKVWELETGREMATLEGHEGSVSGCVVTPDGRHVVSASWDRTLKVWELETGREVATLEGHGSFVTGCAVTPDGRHAVSASWDRTLKVWGLGTGTPDGQHIVSASLDETPKVWGLGMGRGVVTLKGHERSVNSCAATPDGQHVVSASSDKTLKVWELETGREVATLKGHRGRVNGCAVTPDGRHVVSASGDNTLKLWSLGMGRELATLKGHERSVNGCAVTPDGRNVVSASSDKTLKVWELETGREVATLEGHGDSVNGCAVTPDGRHVVSASSDKTLKVWALEIGREVVTLEGHGDSVNGCAVTPDGRHVVSASLDKTLKVWELETGREVATLVGHGQLVTGCVVTPDGRRVVSASWDSTLKVWALETGREVATLKGHEAFVNGCAVTLDGRHVVSASRDCTLKVWELEMGREVATLEGHGASVLGCAVTPDGRHVVSASSDKTLKVWALETGREVATLRGHERPLLGCAVTPDGRHMVSASSDTELKVWELETGREVATLKGHGAHVNGCAVTPDGRHVVSASDDWTLKVWELETGREVATLKGHGAFVNGCAVTPGGRHVVSASRDCTLKVWELEMGREVATLEGHQAPVLGCAVTPDGRHVVSASEDKTLKVWALKTGREVATLEGHSASVTGCAVTPDGRHVVSASHDKTLRVWDINSGQCLHTLYGFHYFLSVAAGSDVICAGDMIGNVWILERGSNATLP